MEEFVSYGKYGGFGEGRCGDKDKDSPAESKSWSNGAVAEATSGPILIPNPRAAGGDKITDI